MTTLSPFLWRRGGKDDRGAEDDSFRLHPRVLGRVIAILLQGITLHGVPPEAAAAIRRIRLELEQATEESAALLAAGAAFRLLEAHGEATAQQAQAMRQETRQVSSLLFRTLREFATPAREWGERLAAIESELAGATRCEDVTAARQRLEDCLAALRTEALAVAESSDVRAAGQTDAVTGLPDAGHAARALQSVWRERGNYYAAVLAMERIETVNLRFGVAAGDQMLGVLTGHVARQLAPEDRLFRWRGPCLLLLVKRAAPEALVSAEVRRLVGARLETSMIFREREVILPIAASYGVFALEECGSAEELVRRVNLFSAGRTRNGKRVLAAST